MSISYKIGDKALRPWGTWEVISVGNNYIVKKICVNSGEMLSLQMHHHRNEHWIIAEGQAEIMLDEATITASTDSSVFIRSGQKHRIANKTDKKLIFIEIQTGETLDENDIVRFDDRYGRIITRNQKKYSARHLCENREHCRSA